MSTVYFVIIGALLVLGFITLLDNPKKRQNIYFFTITLFIVIWIVANNLSNVTEDLSLSLLYNKMIFTSTTLLIFSLALFSTTYPRDKFFENKTSIKYILLLTIPTIIVDLSPSLVKEVQLYDNHSSIIFGYGIVLYLLHFVICLVFALVKLVKSYKEAQGDERLKLQYFILGMILSLIGAGITNIILPIAFNYFDLSNTGPFFLIFFIGFTTISILKYRLFGLKFLFARILKFIVITVLPALFFIIVHLTINFFKWNLTEGKAILSLLSISILFSLLFLFITNKLLDQQLKKFAYGGVNLQDISNEYYKQFSIELDIDKLSNLFFNLISEILQIEEVGIIISNSSTGKIEHINTKGFDKRIIDQQELDTLLKFWKTYKGQTATQTEIQRILEKEDNPFLRDIYHLLTNNNIQQAISLDEKMFITGLIIFGERKDKRSITAEELQLIEEWVFNISVAFSRALLYQEVASFNKTLQQKIDIQTRELQEKVLELKKARAKERDMLDIMGHELRTPAAIIKLNTESLARTIEEQSPKNEGQKKYLKRIKDAIETEIQLINTLLTSAKLEGDKLSITLEEVDAQEIINLCIEGNINNARQKNLEIINKASNKNIPTVYADKSRLMEVLNNFISNSVKYTLKGEITIDTNFDKDSVTFEITDTGIGIPQEEMKNLGQKFYRVENYSDTSTEAETHIVRPGGTGLGLYVNFNLIKKLGGKFNIKSKVGKGSTFTFSIPRYKGQKEEKKSKEHNLFKRLNLKK